MQNLKYKESIDTNFQGYIFVIHDKNLMQLKTLLFF